MLTLKKINRDEEYISAQYIPEDSTEVGFLKVNIASSELAEKKITSYDDIIPNYLSHAKIALIDLSKDKEIPEEKLIMWY